MDLESYRTAEKLIREQFSLYSELYMAVEQAKSPLHTGSILEHYVSGYFPYAIEKCHDAQKCWDYIKTIDDREDKLVEALASKISFNAEYNYVMHREFGFPNVLPAFQDSTRERRYADPLGNFIDTQMEIYGITNSKENVQALYDAEKIQISPINNDDELVARFDGLTLNGVQTILALSETALHTHAIRTARHSLILNLIELYPLEISKIAFNGQPVDEMTMDMQDALEGHIDVTTKMITETRVRLNLAGRDVTMMLAGNEALRNSMN